jgi:next to BRCA1 gene 1 protein
MKHGHHPKHAFEPAVEETQLDFKAMTLLAPGRNVGHNAICDGCDKVYSFSHFLTE